MNLRSLLDRIDIHIDVLRVDYEKLSGDRVGESSESILARVQAAGDIQIKRLSNNGASDIVCNADRHIGWRNMEVLQIARGRSKPNAGGDEQAPKIDIG